MTTPESFDEELFCKLVQKLNYWIAHTASG